jgi:hypothetical protein
MSSADECTICGGWPERDRWALLEMITTLPLQEERICDECLLAFWRNLGLDPGKDNPNQH